MKTFLALSNGGSRGCVQLGMIYEMHRLKGKDRVKWDGIAGISVGSLISAVLCQTTPETFSAYLNILMSMFIDKKFHVVDEWVWLGEVGNAIDAILYHNSLYSNETMKDLIKKHYHPTDVKIPFSVGCYNKTLHRYETFRSDVEDPKSMQEAILASAAVPSILPSVKIDKYMYEDGGMRHLIPILEIEQFLNTNKNEKCCVDIYVCFPIHDPATMQVMLQPQIKNDLLQSGLSIMSDFMIEQLENDMKRLSKLLDVPYEVLTKSNCGEFRKDNMTIRLYSPLTGEYTSMLNMTPEQSIKMFNSGRQAINQYLNPKIKF